MKKLLLSCLLGTSVCSFGQIMDSTYHAVGYSAGLSWPQVNRIFELPDGSTVQGVNDADGVTISKYTADGYPDSTFGAYGRRTMVVGGCVTFAPINNVIADMAVQSDEMVIGVGYATYTYGGLCGFQNMDIFRMRPDGSSDSTFGLCGLQQSGQILMDYPINLTSSKLTNIRLLPGGQYLVTGWGQAGGVTVYDLFMKFNHDGSLDPSFGTNGIFTLPTTMFNNAFGNNPVDITIDSTGNIYALGSNLAPVSGYEPYGQVVKVLPAGALDYTFGDSGVVNLQYGTNNSLTSIKQRGDGKLVIIGEYSTYATVTVLNADGSVDSTSVPGGFDTVAIPGYAQNVITSFFVQDDNKMVVCGYGMNGYDVCAYIARLNVDGTYDLSFNGTGIDSFNYGVYTHWQSGTFLNDMKPVCGNRILAAGGINQTTSTPNQGTFILKLRMDDSSSCTYIMPTKVAQVAGGGNEVKLYPVPTEDNITVSGAAIGARISIANLLGQEMIRTMVANQTETIDLSRLQSGNYIVTVLATDGTKVVKRVTKL